MVKNFELKKESGIFEKDIRVCGFSSTTAHTQCGFQRFCKFSSRRQGLSRLIGM